MNCNFESRSDGRCRVAHAAASRLRADFLSTTWDLRPRLSHVVALRLKMCRTTRGVGPGNREKGLRPNATGCRFPRDPSLNYGDR